MDEQKIYQELRHRFGFAKFRDGQLATIKAIMAGHNTLAVLPTGGGKSLLYQLPGYLMAGTVLIVSPLISLMQDQVDRLHRRGEKGAVMLTGQIYGADRQRLLQNLANYKFIFASPEFLTNKEVVAALQQVQISLLTLSWIGLSLALWGHSPVVWLIVVFINGLMNWLWSRWSVPTIGNGDLEFFLSYGLMWGLTAMAHWLLLAASLALIINQRTTQLAFIPYLLISALFWWLMAS